MTKACTKCKTTQPKSNFRSDPRLVSELKSYCKGCASEMKRNYRRTKIGWIKTLYNNQRHNSRARGHLPPEYTLEDLQAWVDSQSNFPELFSNWEASGYVKDLVPSIDRIDELKGYTLSNIQLMTWLANKEKSYVDHKNCLIIRDQKSIVQYNLEGEVLNTYTSAREAERQLVGLGVTFKGISRCCTTDRKTHAGFIWKFNDDLNKAYYATH